MARTPQRATKPQQKKVAREMSDAEWDAWNLARAWREAHGFAPSHRLTPAQEREKRTYIARAMVERNRRREQAAFVQEEVSRRLHEEWHASTGFPLDARLDSGQWLARKKYIEAGLDRLGARAVPLPKILPPEVRTEPLPDLFADHRHPLDRELDAILG